MLPTRIGALYRMAEFSSLNNWTSERWKIGHMERCLVGLDATSELLNTHVVSSNGLVIYLPSSICSTHVRIYLTLFYAFGAFNVEIF